MWHVIRLEVFLGYLEMRSCILYVPVNKNCPSVMQATQKSQGTHVLRVDIQWAYCNALIMLLEVRQWPDSDPSQMLSLKTVTCSVPINKYSRLIGYADIETSLPLILNSAIKHHCATSQTHSVYKLTPDSKNTWVLHFRYNVLVWEKFAATSQNFEERSLNVHSELSGTFLH